MLGVGANPKLVKIMEEEPSDSPIQLEHVIEVIHEGYILVDEDANIHDVNPAYCEMVGYTREELLDMDLHDVRPGMTPAYQREFIRKAVDEGSVEFETQHRTKEGRMIDLQASAAPIEKDGKIFLAGFVRNVSQEKEAEKKLKKSEQKWQHLIEDNPQPVQVTVDGEIVFINEAGASLYGAEDPDELFGMSVFEFSHPDYEDKIQERKHRLENDLPVDNIHEHKIRRLDGESRYIEVHSIPIQYQGEQAIQTVLYDITERKEKESLIEASLKEKEVLLKEIHHRVKNNMAVISGLLKLQAMNADDDELKDMLKESQLRIYSMAMVHEKLYQTENFSDLGFDEYIQELVQAIKKTVDVPTHNISVEFDIDPIKLSINQAIPAALIINEVVINSYKHAFTDRETGRIVISLAQEGELIAITVRDNGVGLPDDFDIKKQQSLGMNLIQTLARQLDADLSIRSENGTEFQISFAPKE